MSEETTKTGVFCRSCHHQFDVSPDTFDPKGTCVSHEQCRCGESSVKKMLYACGYNVIITESSGNIAQTLEDQAKLALRQRVEDIITGINSSNDFMNQILDALDLSFKPKDRSHILFSRSSVWHAMWDGIIDAATECLYKKGVGK